MRLLFAGTPEAAVPSLQSLLDSARHDVVGVLTRPDAPAGRGRRLVRSPIALLADAHGVDVYTPRTPSDPEFLDTLRCLEVDVCPVVAYGALLRQPVIDVPRVGWVNLHFSLLPAWRGAAPVQHAVIAGDDVTGASTFLIGPGLDDGPVFGVTTETIRPDDTAGDLLARLSVSGAELLRATIDGIADGELSPVDQPVDGVSLAPKITADDARLDFTQPAVAVDRRSRGCTPAPGPWTTWRGERLKLGPVRASAARDAGDLPPGQVTVDVSTVLVGTASRPVALSTVQPAGKRAMPAADWARGARPGPDERLGD